MKQTKHEEYLLKPDEFLDKLGINGNHVVAIESISLVTRQYIGEGGNTEKVNRVLVTLHEEVIEE
jgi:hypothetical protein